MKAIAQFIMRGRIEAAGAVFAGAILPLMQWLSVSAVALVLLRKGIGEGSVLAAWGFILAAIAYYYENNPGNMLLILGTVLLALILRISVSWELTLLAAVLVGGLNGWLFEILAPEYLVQATQFLEKLLAQQMNEGASVPGSSELAGYVMLGQTWAMLVFLIVARYWQALLYNPGGFQQEFHSLKLSPMMTAGLMLAAVLPVVFMGEGAVIYIQLVTIPLVLCGLGFAHWLIRFEGLGSAWIWLLYGSLIFLNVVVYPLVLLVAVLDSWIDLRARIRKKREQG
ncbi:MAG: hypothetical protein OEZ23_07620 [Gammaproteobacteria bacterium]|nr:hypothetical protein [Gammaproteobacteria bacterium]